jgi:capsular exopolysaccharide synthesis family protein
MGRQMDIKAYLATLWGSKWVILATTVVTVAVITIATLLSTSIYTASATLRVASAAGTMGSYSDYFYADRLMNTYTRIATSNPVLEELTKRLDLQTMPDIKVETIPNTELFQIKVESSNPLLAKSVANTLAEILVAQSEEYYSGGGKRPQEILGEQLAQVESELKQARQDYENLSLTHADDSEQVTNARKTVELKERTYITLLDQYEQARLQETIRANTISVVEPADVPRSPSRPRRALNIMLGFLVGLTGGVGLAMLLENLYRRPHTSEQILSLTAMTLLGKIPRASSSAFSLLKMGNGKNHPSTIGPLQKSNRAFIEAFLRLRTNVFCQFNDSPNGRPRKTLLITSAGPHEGKTTIVTNLAFAIAQAGHKVIVVDSDLRLPRLHKNFDLSNLTGLSNVLTGEVSWEKAVQETKIPGLQVLTSGPVPFNPAELLGSSEMKALIGNLSITYDLVLIDGPALLIVTDATVLAPLVDGVVLVVRRNFVKEDDLREVSKELRNIKTHTIGVVVNEAEAISGYYYYRGKSSPQL